jgi:hypothetical protein
MKTSVLQVLQKETMGCAIGLGFSLAGAATAAQAQSRIVVANSADGKAVVAVECLRNGSRPMVTTVRAKAATFPGDSEGIYQTRLTAKEDAAVTACVHAEMGQLRVPRDAAHPWFSGAASVVCSPADPTTTLLLNGKLIGHTPEAQRRNAITHETRRAVEAQGGLQLQRSAREGIVRRCVEAGLRASEPNARRHLNGRNR